MRLLLALVLGLALVPSARALDLVDVWRAAAERDPEFAAARAARDAGSSRRAQAAALWRPTVVAEGSVGYGGNDTSTHGAAFSTPGVGQSTGVDFDTSIHTGTSSRAALALRQPLYDRERDVQGSQLQVSADVAELQWQGAREDLVLRSAERYFDVALAAEQLRLLGRQLEAVERARVEAEDRFRIGDQPITDAREATARAASLVAQRLAAAADLELKRVALADLSGLVTDDVTLTLPSAGMRLPDAGTLAEWLAAAAGSSTALRLAETRLRLAELEAKKTSAAFSPSLGLLAQVGRERLSGRGDFGRASNTMTNGVVALQLTVPLYSGGMREARQTESQALVEKSRAELERSRQQVAMQTRSAWLDVDVGRSRIGALEAASRASDQRLDATRVGREAGDRTTLDVLNAENDAAAADLVLVQARVRWLTGRLRLAALAGRLDETWLAQIGAAMKAAH